MNINGYIRKFGNKTFKEEPFNDIDALILAELSYINIDMLIPEGKHKVKVKEIDTKLFNKEVFVDSVDALYNKSMLKLMMASKRFSNCVLKDVVRKFSKEDINQFFAVNVVLPNGDLFLSYRGTDITLIGWKEDFLLTYQSTFLSQIQALEYADNVLSKCDNKFYLGGHSKGGNLAFYAALHLGEQYEDRLINAYSFDGPGFKDGIKQLKTYESRINRLIKYRTYNDVIGSFYNNMDTYKTVHSTGLLFGGHDPFFWQINGFTGEFMCAKDISSGSKKYSKRVMNWLDSLTYDDKTLATDALFEIFKENDTIYDLAKNVGKNIFQHKKALTRYSDNEQDRLRVLMKRLVKYIVVGSEIKEEKKDNKK